MAPGYPLPKKPLERRFSPLRNGSTAQDGNADSRRPKGHPRERHSGQFAFVDRGGYAFATCHVDNVIEAIQCALERGEGGQSWTSNFTGHHDAESRGEVLLRAAFFAPECRLEMRA
jgi:hypothetical protein